MTDAAHGAGASPARLGAAGDDALPAFLASLGQEPSSASLLPELGQGDELAARALVVAVRRLLVAADAEEVVRAVAGFVLAVGGCLVPASVARGSELPLDLTLGAYPPVLADAETTSTSRMRLEQLLPLLVEDARRTMARLRRHCAPHDSPVRRP